MGVSCVPPQLAVVILGTVWGVLCPSIAQGGQWMQFGVSCVVSCSPPQPERDFGSSLGFSVSSHSSGGGEGGEGCILGCPVCPHNLE